ncbi:MAG: PD-(D/E)XK nuclease family protein [Candidatus Paceibacterota bacterium]|jgi:hypothetical protein
MGKFYRGTRVRNVFNPNSKEPFRISRSKIDDFLNCPRCFYLDRRLGVGKPPSFPFNLNNAVDTLLKKEFDIHRAKQTAHPLMKAYGIDAVPYEHEKIEEWRDALRRGVQCLHAPTNLLITGGVDDVWVNPKGELIIADYKATSKETEVNLDAEWQIGYKRQMEVYQWLFRQNGFNVQNVGYFVYCNGTTDREAFDGKLEFDITLLPYKGNDTWVEPTLFRIHECLMSDEMPFSGPECDLCEYRIAARDAEEK